MTDKKSLESDYIVTKNNNNNDTNVTKHGFTPFVAVCFTVNYLIGTGFLTLPWAFQQGGILLSTITMIVVVLICNMSKNYVLQAMARAAALVELGRKEEEQETLPMHNKEESERDLEYGTMQIDEHFELAAKGEGSSSSSPSSSSSSTTSSEHYADDDDAVVVDTGQKQEILMVKDRKFEYTELCRMFLGNIGEKSYVASVALSITLQLWGYTAVFSSAMAEEVPLGFGFDGDYRIYTLLFAAVVVPVSCLELKEQVAFQMFLSFCRFLVIFLMIQTTVVASMPRNHAEVHFVGHDGAKGTTWVDFSGFYAMFSILVYTAMFHNGIPVLSEPVADRRKLATIFQDAIIVVCIACWVLGAVVAHYFGDEIEQSANLNWSKYVGGTGRLSDDGSGKWVDVAFWVRATSWFIVCFPALNVMSAYPLNAIVLGNNLLVGACGSSAETDRLVKVFFRLLASTPPIIGAFFVKELGIITSYAGVLAFVTVLAYPALLFISSKRAVEKRGKMNATYYDGWGSTDAGASIVLVISVMASIYTLVKLI